MPAKITSCRAAGRFRVHLVYADGVEGVVDLSHLVGKGVFKAWDAPGVFESVTIDERAGTIAWPGGIDLDPYVLRAKITGGQLPGAKPNDTSAA